MIPVAIGRSSLPSLAVKTLLRTWPNSFPVLVTQGAVPAAAPASFLVTWYKVEKDNWYSYYYNNCLSNKRNIFWAGQRGGGGTIWGTWYVIFGICRCFQTKDYYWYKGLRWLGNLSVYNILPSLWNRSSVHSRVLTWYKASLPQSVTAHRCSKL